MSVLLPGPRYRAVVANPRYLTTTSNRFCLLTPECAHLAYESRGKVLYILNPRSKPSAALSLRG